MHYMLVIIVYTLLCIYTLSGTHAAYSDRITANQLFQYTFDQTKTSFPIVADNNISPVGTLSATSGVSFTSNRIGLTFGTSSGGIADRLVSNGTIASMMSTIGTNGPFTVELWAKVSITQSAVLLFAIGSSSSTSPTFIDNTCPGYDMAIVQSGDTVTCYFRVSSATSCRTQSQTIPPGTDQLPIHIVCSRDQTTGYIYATVNGEQSLPQTASGTYATWNATNDRIHIGRQTTVTAFNGEVYLAAMYSQFFDSTAAKTNYNAYLPNSAPYTSTYTPTPIGEGLIGNISLVGYDWDIVTNVSWSLAAATSLAAGDNPLILKPTSLQPLPLTYRILTPLPIRGNLSGSGSGNDLVSFQSSRITSSLLPYTVTRSDSLVFYRGEQYQFGTNYASLTFDANDGISTTSSRTISWDLYFINDPPVCISAPQIVDAQYPSILRLNGTDPDQIWPILFKGTGYIITLPTRGKLYQTSDGITAGALINDTTTPVLVNNTDMKLIYVSDPPPTGTSGETIVFTDLLQFYLVDELGLMSSNTGNITIQVRNNLQPLETTAPCIEDVSCSFNLQAIDRLGTATITFSIISLPSHGILWQSSSSSSNPLKAADLPITVTGGNGSLWYQADANWNGYETFTFIAIRGTYQSYVGTMRLYVAAVNDAPTITGPSSLSIQFLGNLYPVYIIYDVDRHIGDFKPADIPYHVTVSSAYLNSPQLTFSVNSSTVSSIDWILGDGWSDYKFDFNALYSVLTVAFKPLTVQSADKTQPIDTITIVVTDNDPVLSLSGSIQTTVTVTGTETASSSGDGAFSPVVRYAVWAGAGVAVLLCIGCCVQRYRKKKTASHEHNSNNIYANTAGV